MADIQEQHILSYGKYDIIATIINRSGFYMPVSFVMYKNGIAMNHKLSESAINDINIVLSEYCNGLNEFLH